jgi:ABC-2 type transport system ATP-binding protein
VERGTLDELRHLTRTTISVRTDRPLTGLAGRPGVHGLRLDGRRATFDVDTPALDGVIRYLSDHGIRALESRPPTLEELFLRHYGDRPAASDRAA